MITAMGAHRAGASLLAALRAAFVLLEQSGAATDKIASREEAIRQLGLMLGGIHAWQKAWFLIIDFYPPLSYASVNQ